MEPGARLLRTEVADKQVFRVKRVPVLQQSRDARLGAAPHVERNGFAGLRGLRGVQKEIGTAVGMRNG